jgi:tRNA (guanosine-2'-O-)-methyltransferase
MRPMKRTPIKRLYEEFAEKHPAKVKLMFFLQNFQNGANVGSMFRLAEACEAELIVTGNTPLPPDPDVIQTAAGQENRVKVRKFIRIEDGLEYVKSQGFSLVALEICEGAQPYNEFKFPEKTCIVLGNEFKGIFPQVLSKCEHAVYIPMFGKNYSLNVHVSAAITAFKALIG